MKVTITLDEDILGHLQEETGTKIKAEAVLLAVEDYLRRRRIKKILDQAGHFKFDSMTTEWRHREC